METPERDSDDINRETAEEQEEQGGRFDRESGSEAVPTRTDLDEELEDRGDV
jgi:hypothetical protein